MVIIFTRDLTYKACQSMKSESFLARIDSPQNGIPQDNWSGPQRMLV